MLPLDTTSLLNSAREIATSVLDAADRIRSPSLRIGVTGLSRAGKTVFITALIQALIEGGQLNAFSPAREERIMRARLVPQPNDLVPRFAYEEHVSKLIGRERAWPDSTFQISEMRIEIEYMSHGGWSSAFTGKRKRSFLLDIVDYPGEWLLDLPLLSKSYAEWCAETFSAMRNGGRRQAFAPFLALAEASNPSDSLKESTAKELARLFTEGLRACRADQISLSSLPPGRFLMPGDLEGSPALTFAPLLGLSAHQDAQDTPTEHSLAAAMERRFEAYKSQIILPFFRNHFSRLDRQIVLVDLLSSLNAGSEAMHDLENALKDVLACFNIGENTWLSSLFAPRIEKILFAATKADHLHESNHDRLESILRLLLRKAMLEAKATGVETDVLALASIRATKNAEITRKGETLHCIAGTPLKGENFSGQILDGETEIALFPGDLPANANDAFKGEGLNLRFLRFRPPLPETNPDGTEMSLPHIRLGRALEFLIGDKLD